MEYNAKKGGYHFTGPVSELSALQLTRGELVSLFIAKHALEPLRGTKLARTLAASVEKIAEACPEHVSFHWQELDEAFSVKASGVSPANVEVFSTLLDAAMNRKEVTFSYLKLTGSKKEVRHLQPYHVGQVDHAWYLIGFDLDRLAIRNFALSRLSDLRASSRHFTKPEDFDARRYLNGGFGVWGYGDEEARTHEVEIEFAEWAARVVAERQWHATQEIEELDGTASPRTRFRATVSGLEEITRWVLGWGSKARVIGPEELKLRVMMEAQSIIRNCGG
ncbi:MAG: WYL domain-containing protein [Verrucomicrobiaceae bacterium]|nr:WYL domain-containing protein [Verrucomicrobiaceae bacterium]